MSGSLFLNELEIHSDWLPFLSDDIRTELSNIESEVDRSGYTPAPGKVLRFLTLPLVSAKIIILGQDPYPQPGVATGRAFEVGNLQSWSQPFSNISLRNILRGLYRAYTGEVITFNKLRERIFSDFPILPPARLFEHWENQGVLLLNTSFTCEPSKPGSHKKLWEDFTEKLLCFIAGKAPGITWFIWGNHASQAVKDIPVKNFISTLHPMMCYELPGRNKDFLYGNTNCFEPFLEEIDWTGYGNRNHGRQQELLF